MDWSLLLLRVALALYALGCVAAYLPFSLGRLRLMRLTPWLTGAGGVAHSGALVALGLRLDRCPLGTLPEVLSFLAWTAVWVYLGVFWRYRLEVLHLIIPPLILVVLFVSGLLPEELLPVADPYRATLLLRFHITVIVLGVAALFITFAASLVYVLVDRALKAKRPGAPFVRWPSLERCDRIGRASLLWAFPLLTLGIITGALVSVSRVGTFWSWNQRETLAVLAWIILGAVLLARLGWGWRGRKAAILTIVGFAAVFLRMLGY